MDAWILATENAEPITGTYRLVFSKQEATPMNEHNAHEMMRRAELSDPGYEWNMDSTPVFGAYLVHGTDVRR